MQKCDGQKNSRCKIEKLLPVTTKKENFSIHPKVVRNKLGEKGVYPPNFAPNLQKQRTL
jgi:hypothetical protein